MNRNRFVKSVLTALAFLSTSTIAISKAIINKRANKGIKVDAGKDRHEQPIRLFEGDEFFIKVSTKDTDGDLFIFESTREKKGGPPLHYHFEQDEWWYILEGEFLFQVGEEKFTVKKGDSVFGPRMVPHAFAKTNEGPARLLMGFQPAGKMEANFKAHSEGKVLKMTQAEKDIFREESGFKVVGPALIYDKTQK